MRALWLVCVLVGAAGSFGADGEQGIGDLINTKCRRSVDVSSQFARTTIGLAFRNQGKTPLEEYFLAFPMQQAARLSYITAGDHEGNSFKVTRAPTIKGGNGAVHFRVSLGLIRVRKGEEFDLKLEYLETSTMRPLPATVRQEEPALMVYEGNHFWFSPYTTTALWTEVLHGAIESEGNSELPPTKVKEGSVEYGPYTHVPAYSLSPLSVHHANKGPFLRATASTREVEVSHWGSVAIEDSLEILHTGPALMGFFSRFDYQSSTTLGGTAVGAFRALLPSCVSGVYYRDEIGNISTSRVEKHGNLTVLDLKPRFPLFGGWRTAFTVGYNVPLRQMLERDLKDTSYRRLSVDFGLALEGLYADNHTTRVILPEGAHDIKVKAPFEIEESRDVKFTYLDTTGRPVVVITKANIVSGFHNQPIHVLYKFQQTWMAVEPILCVMGFFTLFMLLIIKIRLSPEDPLQDLVIQFKALHDKRRKERAAMASKWADFITRNGDKEAFKAAKAHCKDVMDKLASEGEALLQDCIRIAAKDEPIISRMRAVNKSEADMAELRTAMYSPGLAEPTAEAYASSYDDLKEQAEVAVAKI